MSSEGLCYRKSTMHLCRCDKRVMTTTPTENEIEVAAVAAEARQDRIGIEGTWALMRERYPANVLGYLRAGIYLRDLGAYAEADALFERGFSNCVDARPLRIHHAWSAFYRMDWDLALQRWQALAHDMPMDPMGHGGVALSLLRMGKFKAARDTIAMLPSVLTDDIDLSIVMAQVASAQQDWTVALALWSALKARVPEHEKVVRGYGNALQQVSLMMLDESQGVGSERPPERQSIVAVDNPIARDLMMRFESFGDNCEFGLVQRHFGAEPIGLLRWTDVPAEQLARMLESRFVGLGEVDCSQIMLVGWGEYFIMDQAFGLGIHTWVNEHEGDAADIFARQTRRIRRLRDELLELLEEGGQIVVYRPRRRLDEMLRQRIFKALRAIGCNTLLLVEAEDGTNPPGTLRELAPGLVVGYISHLSPVPINGRQVWDIPFDLWLEICRVALVYHDKQSAVATFGPVVGGHERSMEAEDIPES
ncbi:MAG: hypothetical protein H7251_04995 [Acetobacteraceae bacterium]|nr:hypothetical protein [Acetobacteraceae bacterium]